MHEDLLIIQLQLVLIKIKVFSTEILLDADSDIWFNINM